MHTTSIPRPEPLCLVPRGPRCGASPEAKAAFPSHRTRVTGRPLDHAAFALIPCPGRPGQDVALGANLAAGAPIPRHAGQGGRGQFHRSALQTERMDH